MRVKLNNNKNFTGEYLRQMFVNGISEGHVDANTYAELKYTLGVEPEYIPDEVTECENCIALQKELDKLKKKLKE